MSALNATNSLFSTCTSHRRMAQIIDRDEWEPCLDSPVLRLAKFPTDLEKYNTSVNLMERSITRSQRGSNYTRNGVSLASEKMPLSNLDTAGLNQKSHEEAIFRTKKPLAKSGSCVGFCVKLYLCNSLFIFLIFVALLIGYWASLDGIKPFSGEAEVNQSTSKNKTAQKSTAAPTSRFVLLGGAPNGRWLKPPKNPMAVPTKPNTTFNGTINKAYNKFQHHKFLTKTPKISSLLEIYPPEDDLKQNDFLNTVHWHSSQNTIENLKTTAQNPYHQQQILVPLPKNVLPSHYDLQLDFTEFDTHEHIRGNMSILLESFGNSTDDEIIFHAARNIFIQKIRLRQNSQWINIKSAKRDFQRSLVRLILNDRLKPAWYKLYVEFRTKICQSEPEGSHCIYSSQEKTPKIIGFVTKFEPCFARTFIPGWDEPRVKASFDITITHRNGRGLTLLANSAQKSSKAVEFKNSFHVFQDKDGKIQTTTFLTTPKMSLYLLSFAIGPFAALEMQTIRNIPLTFWMEPDNLFAAHFAANFSPVIFERIEKDFGVNYPLTKMDFVIVSNYPVGGMENWGLVIFHANTVLRFMTKMPVTSQSVSEEEGKLYNESSIIILF